MQENFCGNILEKKLCLIEEVEEFLRLHESGDLAILSIFKVIKFIFPAVQSNPFLSIIFSADFMYKTRHFGSTKISF